MIARKLQRPGLQLQLLYRFRVLKLGVGRASRRWLSSQTASLERIQVPAHNSGLIDIDLHLPPHWRPGRADEQHPQGLDVLFHLPAFPAGLLKDSQSQLLRRDVQVLSPARLAHATALPVIEPHYRLDDEHLFPTPIHDATVAYEGAIEWMQQTVIRADEEYTPPARSQDEQDRQIRVGLTGDLIGGSLAMALGLTGCRITDPARVVAISASEPILDWNFEHDRMLQRDATASGNGTEHTEPTDEQDKRIRNSDLVGVFHILRQRSFPGRLPSKYFDPFASPLHFLRSPSSRVPTLDPATGLADATPLPAGFEDADEDPQVDEAEDEELARTVGAPDLYNRSPSPSSDADSSSPPSDSSIAGPAQVKRPMAPNDPRRFKRPLRYPQAVHAPYMIPPRIQIITGTNSLLRPQAVDFVRLLRRGLLRGKGYKMSRNIEKAMMDEDALVVEEEKQGAHMQDERLQLIRRGMQQFQLANAEAKDRVARTQQVAGWLMGR